MWKVQKNVTERGSGGKKMQSSIGRKLAKLLIFHSKASKTEIYSFIPVNISAKWFSLSAKNIISEKLSP